MYTEMEAARLTDKKPRSMTKSLERNEDVLDGSDTAAMLVPTRPHWPSPCYARTSPLLIANSPTDT